MTDLDQRVLIVAGNSLPEWLYWIQHRIAAHTKPTDDPNHGATDMRAWLLELIDELERTWPDGWRELRAGDQGSFDENMRMARELSLLLAAWFASVARAKSRDPNRPVALRREAHERRQWWIEQMVRALVDDRADPDVFPGQRWESPFLPDATDGEFV
jgi:hypothetical protein